MRISSVIIIFVGLLFVFNSVQGIHGVSSNFNQFNEMDVTLIIEGSDGLVSETEPISAGIFLLALISAPLKFFFLGALFAVTSKRVARRFDWI